MKLNYIAKALVLAGLLSMGAAYAAGVKPDTSVLIINVDDGEGVMNIKNTDPSPIMLLTKIEHIAEDKSNLITVTPPLARVEANKTQLVRFILTGDRSFKTQRLQRVYFEGLPIKARDTNNIEVTVRQNLPVIINPQGLAAKRDPWTLLHWSVVNHQLVVKNDSPYVVRLAQSVKIQPANQELILPRAYVLPGDNLTLKTPNNAPLGSASKVTLYPATIYGYSVDSYTADIGK
ncbi:putative periplasmic chaperone protein [Yersinia mollaretii]|uniref:fimbria/pilus chaperone family protein n=1 Tax=Yersinia mollaretii TaxID=33060 RepID=UPI0005DC6667|nr:fimbria/pilus chaperone family protein [Yersinia mollaretii]CNK99746.1 putative periplasmic chaperone protein [Yersinia mollaretii]